MAEKIENKQLKKSRKGLYIFLIVLLILILIVAGYYFIVINNIFASKLDIEKPVVDLEYLAANPGTQVIFEEHIEYLANEIGAYKLHSSGDSNAVILFEMTDINEKIALIKNGEAYATNDIPGSYDIVIKGEQMVVGELIMSEDLVEDLKTAVNNGEIEIQVISDQATLASKGYLAIYQEFA